MQQQNQAQTFTAYVTETAQQVPTKWGQRVVLKCQNNGQEFKIWGDPVKDQNLFSYAIGTALNLEQRGKNLHVASVAQVQQPMQAQQMPQQPPVQQVQPQARAPIARDLTEGLRIEIEQNTRIFKECFDQTQLQFQDNYSDDFLRCVATSVFIQSKRKFEI